MPLVHGFRWFVVLTAFTTTSLGVASAIVSYINGILGWASLVCVILLKAIYIYSAQARTRQWAHRFFIRPVLILALAAVLVVYGRQEIVLEINFYQYLYQYDPAVEPRWKCGPHITSCYARWGFNFLSLVLAGVVVLEVLLTLSTGGKAIPYTNPNQRYGRYGYEDPTEIDIVRPESALLQPPSQQPYGHDTLATAQPMMQSTTPEMMGLPPMTPGGTTPPFQAQS
ncbi:hypothetical protein BGZ83_003124 [Gryganskiella cystojenkinii]|nr:hypothetical protein BGZ83_003124 [Gryganskiella cystojenkinii]